MNQDTNTTNSSSSDAKTLVMALLGFAGKALVNHLIEKAQQAPASKVEETSSFASDTYTHASNTAGTNYLNEAFAIDQQRVEETRRHLGDDAAAALERANKEEYARVLRDMLRDSSDSMREIARNLGR